MTLTLAGLPKEYPAPKIEVPADKSEFTLEVRFAAQAKPAELKNIKLTATMLLDAADPKSSVKSNDIGVTIKVVAK